MGSRFVPKILIVEDDDDLRDMMADAFKDLGFGVGTASTGLEAVEMVEADHFDLMVTDVMLPKGLNGVEVVTYARARDPNLRSLFISGYSEPVTDDPRFDDFVTKPFRVRELVGCAFELLTRKASARPRLNNPRHAAERAMVEAKVACLKQQGNQP